MPDFIQDYALGTLFGVVLYAAVSIYAFKIENDYQRHFEQPLRTFREMTLSILCGAICTLIYTYLAATRISWMAIPCLWAGAGSLVATYRIDRSHLIIPDRLQVIGLISGIGYLSALIYSGESRPGLFLEVGFAFAMVAMLWLLSVAYERLRGTVGFGFGDTKLLAWLAFFAGKRMPNLVFISVGVGLTFLITKILINGIANQEWQLPKSRDAFAFGPAIVWAVLIEGILYYGS